MKQQTLIDAIIGCDDERSAEFLISIIEQRHDNPLLKLSDKQEAWLEALAENEQGDDYDYLDDDIPW